MLDLAKTIDNVPSGETYIFFAGQAGYIIKSRRGRLLGIDLYLSDSLETDEGHIGFKRLQQSILKPDEIVLDILIATHPHLDHFDKDSVPGLMKNGVTRLYASKLCTKLVDSCKIDKSRVIYVSPSDIINEEDFDIHFINCDHGEGAPDAVGVIIKVDEKIVLEVGDTCLRLDRVAEYTSLGIPDVMIAPINGAYGNLNEEECAILSSVIKPDITIPCHFGMFASHGGSPGKFYNIMKSKYPDRKILFMAQGDFIKL